MLACLCMRTFVKQLAHIPNPPGPSSRQIPSSCIKSASKQVSAELIQSAITTRTRGPYNKYTPKEKDEIASYAV